MNHSEIKKLILATGLKPSSAAGQHFLMDESVCEKVVAAANVAAGETVLEIGPGFGVLTNILLACGANVLAVELDRRIASYLRKKFAEQKNLTLVEGDVFRVRLDKMLHDRDYKFVANLPYSATSMVFRQFLTQAPRPSTISVLIQREVADRIVAPAGAMSLLALSVQYYGQPEKIIDVEPEKFYPAPKVTSSVIKVDHLIDGDGDVAKIMFRLAKIAFAGKRKQLRRSLSSGLKKNPENVENWLMLAGIAPEARPQELSVDNWLMLAKNIAKLA